MPPRRLPYRDEKLRQPLTTSLKFADGALSKEKTIGSHEKSGTRRKEREKEQQETEEPLSPHRYMVHCKTPTPRTRPVVHLSVSLLRPSTAAVPR